MLIVRYDEITLKGNNRGIFERQLAENIKAVCARHGVPARVSRPHGRILIDSDIDPACLRCVFGIVSVSSAVRVSDIDSAKLAIAQWFPRREQTFRISCQRVDKSFHLTSREVCVELGAWVASKSGAKVRLDAPDVDIGVEIIDGSIYVFGETLQCFGGLPSGVEGTVLLNAADSDADVAGVLMLKRGCTVVTYGADRVPALVGVFSPAVVALRKGDLDDELPRVAVELGASAFVCTDTFPGAGVAALQMLSPLVGMTREEIDDFRARFSGACCRHELDHQ